MKVVITGGHHSSALPVIQELKSINPDIQIIWFGHRTSQKGNDADTLEYKEIVDLNVPFYALKTGKFYRNVNFINLLKICFGFVQAFLLLLRIRPNVILSFGGYLAVPVVIMGWLLRIPSITHEQTLVVGYANKLISKFAKKILISWESSAKFFPKSKVIYVGLPLRESITKVLSKDFKIKNKLPTVYVTGGKTGSHDINMLIKEGLPTLLQSCNIIHQCGDHTVNKDYENILSYYDSIKKSLPKTFGDYFLTKFVMEDQIGEVFSKTNLVISRAGAHITAELITLEKPAILIPISWVSHNEQYENALMLKGVGLGEILDENNLDVATFVTAVEKMLNNLKKYKLKDTSVKNLFKKDCAKLIAHAVLNI